MRVTAIKKPDVFISYSAHDRSSVEIIARRLREEGIEPWLDLINLAHEDNWQVQLGAVLNQCTSCLVVLNAANFLSEYNAYEFPAIERRLGQGNFKVVPITLAGSSRNQFDKLPVFLHPLLWLNFPETLDDEQLFQRLFSAIRRSPAESISNNTFVDENLSNQQANKTTRQLRTIKTIRLPDIDWVEIPSGSFIYGEESSKQTLTLERFFISRYLITNCQYQTFIDAGGYHDERWWIDLIKPEPNKSTWSQANRPRENVNWQEALAFTRWLSVKLGYDITLPTEQQWEKAARGTDGREYPWGDDFKFGYANFNDPSAGEDNLQQTTAVGMFPHSQSPYQVMDMAGNVWEWCLNKLARPEQTTPDQSNDERVARGGSWHNSPEKARSTVRYQHGPVNRQYSSLGFRVVCSSPFA